MRRRRPQRGSSFIELLMVMGGMAILMGLAVGFLSNIGGATHLAQAKALMVEAAYECIGKSSGGGRATFTLRESPDEGLQLRAITASPVLTHQFEDLQFASGAREPQVLGNVESVRGGRTGKAAKFSSGGYLEFGAESGFAMTEGLELEAWIKPAAGPQRMYIIRAASHDEDVYAVTLEQEGQGSVYKLQLQLKLRGAEESERTPGLVKTIRTEGAPVVADGSWQHISVRFDGVAASFRVNGIDVPSDDTKTKRRDTATADVAEMSRIVIPESGVLKLTISAPSSSFKGLIDGLQLRGVFRIVEQELPGRLTVIAPKLPIFVEYANGRLDPAYHTDAVTIRFRDEANPGGVPLRLTLDTYDVEAKFTRRTSDAVRRSSGGADDEPDPGSTLDRLKKNQGGG